VARTKQIPHKSAICKDERSGLIIIQNFSFRVVNIITDCDADVIRLRLFAIMSGMDDKEDEELLKRVEAAEIKVFGKIQESGWQAIRERPEKVEAEIVQSK
jgi:hypothetical protein